MRKFVALVLLCLLPAATAAQPIPVVTENLPPFSIVEGEDVSGVATEIVTTLFERTGLSIKLSVMPWRRAMETAQSNPGQFIYSMIRSADREGSFAWVAPLLEVRLTLYRLRSRPEVAAGTLEEVRRRGKVVVINGDGAKARLREFGFTDDDFFILPERTAGDQRLRLIESHRAEYMISNPQSFNWRIKRGEVPDAFEPVLELPAQSHMYLAAHPATDPALIARLQAVFAEMEKDGTRARIEARYR